MGFLIVLSLIFAIGFGKTFYTLKVNQWSQVVLLFRSNREYLLKMILVFIPLLQHF